MLEEDKKGQYNKRNTCFYKRWYLRNNVMECNHYEPIYPIYRRQKRGH